ncbi:macrolide family glycosyltransferase [Saccharothrix obliqua]|uniref:macrolide family glycosyltransferase n=1 Tax=Saccharothrix obliqua TaxID=2861747 RepID=UPI003557758B
MIEDFGAATVSHIAFLNIPGHGHVNPTLPVVAELAARGHQVTYAVPAAFTAQVEHAGAVPVVYPTTLPTSDDKWPTGMGAALQLFLREAKEVLPHLERAYADHRPDLVVYDIAAWTARVLAERWGVPAVQFSPTFVAYEGWEEEMGDFYDNPEVRQAFQDIETWLRAEGSTTDPRTYVGHPDRAVVSIPRSFQPNGDSVPAKYTFVGPCLGNRAYQGDWTKPADKDVLLISLGSADTDRPDFYRACVAAFADAPNWHVVMSIGKHVSPDDLGAIPDNFEVHRWVPQLHILGQATAFITHCGMGGTMEGLHHGVPMVGVPGMAEQTINAERLEALGVGKHIPRDQATPEALRQAVTDLTTSTEVATSLAKLKQEIKEAGGTTAAANTIEAEIPRT